MAVSGVHGGAIPLSPNYIINGAFDFWQRGTSFSNLGSGAYGPDRFRSAFDGTAGSYTISRQSFPLGGAPVAGYDGSFFARYAVTSFGTGSIRAFDQGIEDVRTLAGKTVTLSAYIKTDANRNISFNLYQNFGSGGSGEVSVNTFSFSSTTSWQRFSATFNIPSVSEKTIGSSSALWVRIITPAGVNATTDIWGVQLEEGLVATPFRRNANSIQGELAACQRYFQRIDVDSSNSGAPLATGFAISTTVAKFMVSSIVTPRVTPLINFSSGTGFRVWDGVNVAPVTTAMAATGATAANPGSREITATVASGLTQYRPYHLIPANATAAFIEFNAEL